jgi:glycosyltransferase involved in cell wall biosynthesis
MNQRAETDPAGTAARGLPTANDTSSTVLPRLSIIICSLNGASGVDRCLRAVDLQSIRSVLELIVVDDGSTDATSEVGRAHAAVVVRHETNRGLAAARNSGLAVARAPLVAFLDDDCEPDPVWAEQLLAAYDDGVIGVGGPIVPAAEDGFMLGYLKRNNPLRPLESNLANSERLLYRLKLYVRRQWTPQQEPSQQEVYSFAGANMSFVRRALIEAGRFDERFRFGGEDLDACLRLRRAFPSGRLAFAPKALVVHHFEPTLRDALRRSRAYGRGSARLYRKWPSMPATFFPGPVLVLGTLLASLRARQLAVVAAAMPHLLYPRGLGHAIARRSPASLLDAYVQLAQETSGNIGFLDGLWRFRHLASLGAETGAEAAEVLERRGGTGPVQ